MQKQKLLFIINPISGKNVGRTQEDAIIARLKTQYDVQVRYTQQKGDGTTLVREFGTESDCIAVFGGDGTLNEAITGMQELSPSPTLICLPGGTTNLMADTLGIPISDPVLAASVAIFAPPRPYDLGKINQEYFACVVSFGAFADSSYNTPQKLKNWLGYGAYVIGGARSLLNIRSYPMHIEADAGVFEDKYMFGSISNCAAVGGIVKFARDVVQVDDGLFEVVLVKSPKSPLGLARALSCLHKKDYDSRYVEFFQTRQLRLHSQRPVAWSIDGEYRGDMPDANISILPSALHIQY